MKISISDIAALFKRYRKNGYYGSDNWKVSLAFLGIIVFFGAIIVISAIIK